MKRWFYYLWWKTKATRKLIELTNCKPHHAMQFVKEITKTIQPYVWVPANPEKFIESKINDFNTFMKGVVK